MTMIALSFRLLNTALLRRPLLCSWLASARCRRFSSVWLISFADFLSVEEDGTTMDDVVVVVDDGAVGGGKRNNTSSSFCGWFGCGCDCGGGGEEDDWEST